MTPERWRRTVIVGDSLTSDILGGCNAGLDSIWYNPGRKVNSSEIQPTWETDSFAAIRQVILGENSTGDFQEK